MSAVITHASVVGGHDGRAEIEVEITYANGGVATISLDEEACTASLDRAGVTSIDQLVGRPWNVVLPSLEPQPSRLGSDPNRDGQTDTPVDTRVHPPIDTTPEGTSHARPRHP